MKVAGLSLYLSFQDQLNKRVNIIMEKLTGNAKSAVDCLRALRRKTTSKAEKKKIDKRIKEIKQCCK